MHFRVSSTWKCGVNREQNSKRERTERSVASARDRWAAPAVGGEDRCGEHIRFRDQTRAKAASSTAAETDDAATGAAEFRPNEAARRRAATLNKRRYR